MKASEFYGHVAAAFGTCWLVALIVAFLGQEHIELGLLGFRGFLAIGVLYALVRCHRAGESSRPIDVLADRPARLEARLPLQPHDPDST